MALAIDNDDNAASGSGVSTLNIGTRLNGGGGMTIAGGDILLIHVGTSDPTSLKTVSSISDTASLSWAKRASSSMTGGQFSAHVGGELWWAYCASPQTGYTATIHLSAATDCVAASIIAVKGFSGTNYHSNPFDANGVLPVTATSTTTTVPGANVSTTSAATMLIGAGALSANSVSGVGSGYTNTAGGLFILNGGVSNGVGTLIQQRVVTSSQSGAADNLNATTSNGWVWISDALGQSAGGGHQMPSMGFG